MTSYVLLAAGLVVTLAPVGFVAGYAWCLLRDQPRAIAQAVARADFEWANFLENHIVGPTQTKHPRRG